MFDKSQIRLVVLLLIPVFFSIVAISSYSLWIDETYTALYASFPHFTEVLTQLKKASGSEVQMPGYIFSIWLWEKIAGHGEFALRSFNLIPLLLFYFILFFSKIEKERKVIIAVLISLSPFVWFNLNEARSTISLLAFAGIILTLFQDLLLNTAHKQHTKINLIFIFSILGFAFNMLFGFFLFALLIYFVLSNKNEFKNLNAGINFLKKYTGYLFYLIPFFLITFYFLLTILRGAGGMKEKTGIVNISFTAYEFLGFLGVGPPRNMLRDNLSLQLLKPYSFQLLILSFAFAIVVFFVLKLLFSKQKTRNTENGTYLFVSFILGFTFFFLVAFVIHFRFWGRHLAFFFPMLVFAVAAIWTQVRISKMLKSFVVLTILSFWIYSDYHIRFSEQYQKENYKLAVQKSLAYKQNGKTVILCGADLPANYYQLKIVNQKNYPFWIVTDSVYNYQSVNFIKDSSEKVLVMFSKYDLSDPTGEIRNYIKKEGFLKIEETKDFITYKK